MVCRTPLLEREVTIIRRMKHVLKLPVTKIATAVGRNKTSVYKALSPKFKMQKRGRPESFSSKDVSLLVRTLKAMIQESAGQLEITLAMLLAKRCKISAGEACVRKALRKRNMKFRKLRSDPPRPAPPRTTTPRPAPPRPATAS